MKTASFDQYGIPFEVLKTRQLGEQEKMARFTYQIYGRPTRVRVLAATERNHRTLA